MVDVVDGHEDSLQIRLKRAWTSAYSLFDEIDRLLESNREDRCGDAVFKLSHGFDGLREARLKTQELCNPDTEVSAISLGALEKSIYELEMAESEYSFIVDEVAPVTDMVLGYPKLSESLFSRLDLLDRSIESMDEYAVLEGTYDDGYVTQRGDLSRKIDLYRRKLTERSAALLRGMEPYRKLVPFIEEYDNVCVRYLQIARSVRDNMRCAIENRVGDDDGQNENAGL